MIEVLNWVTIISMLLMTLLILVQTRGASLGAGLGGGGGDINTVRRGTDKSVHQMTVIIAIIFAGSILAGIVIA
jgi:preprotein translocase subunit SecG